MLPFTPVIKDLVHLSLLERTTPALLMRFLLPFTDYLEARGVVMSTANAGHEWVAGLHRVLTSVDPQMPGALQQALLDVADLAGESGHEALMNLAGERQLNLFSGAEPLSPEDLAFSVYLDHSEVFQGAHTRVSSQVVRRFVDFHPRVPRPFPVDGLEAKRVLLSEQLRRWFRGRNRTGYVDVRYFPSAEEISLLIIHGQPPRNLSVIKSASSRDRLSIIPDKQDTVLFSRATKHLSINASYAAEHDFYRMAIGRVFFDDPEHFEPKSVLDCSVFLEDPASVLSTLGVPTLQAVTLRRVDLRAVDPPYDTVRWNARDLTSVFQSEVSLLMARRREVRSVTLMLDIAGEARPKKLTITPPNKLEYDRRTNDDVVRTYLFSRGILRLPHLIEELPADVMSPSYVV